MNKAIQNRIPPFALSAFVVAAALSCGAVRAAPASGAVAAGSATITTAPLRTTITQTSQNAVINWQSFGIAAGEAVRFDQPNANAVVLNRVTGSEPSAIYGNLSANGKVFLVNPGGILFGSGASVNVGGLVASTLSITDNNFMAGRYQFSGTSTGSVVNQGVINADGGYVALLGASVTNNGSIQANLGSVVLAAGKAITLEVMPGGLLSARVDEGAVNALVQNGGLIQADGGQVLMTAQAAGVLLGSVVNNTGMVRAQSISNRNGSIQLLGDMNSGTVNVSGTLDASGRSPGQNGGRIVVTAHHTGLFGANIDASGDTGGGTVLLGGGFQGRGLTVANATASYLSADAVVRADAVSQGNGGTVVLWANESTRAYGTITARGGATGGSGGMIETSGHWLDVTGLSANASAPQGAPGNWLLDPADVTIGTGTTSGSLSTNFFTPDSGASASTVDSAALRIALEATGGTNVTITTTNAGAQGNGFGDITVASELTWTPGNAATLTLSAARDVNINADMSATRGNLVVCCGRDINVRALVTTVSGSVLLSAGRDLIINRVALDPGQPLLGRTNVAGIRTTTGNIAMCASHDIKLTNSFDAGALITQVTSSTTLNLDLAEYRIPAGMLINAGTGGTGPGLAGGTVILTPMAPGTSLITVTDASIFINYNPVSYLAPNDYSSNFTRTNAPLSQRMLVFPQGDKTADGSTSTTLLATLKGDPPGATLLAGVGATASFDTAAVGVGKEINFSGYALDVPSQAIYALPVLCCGPLLGKGLTSGRITPAAIPPLLPTPGPVVPVVIDAPGVQPDGTGGPVVQGPTYTDLVMPQYPAFVVAPVLLQPFSRVLDVTPVTPAPMQLVAVQAPAPVAPRAVAAPAQVVPEEVVPPIYVAPPRPAKPYRN
ncbi:MAG: filamentous hemagglutinin N-terminal domain-containing protein [Bdellovibrionales bacterium]|nr:filamentous hemagglutinin N-terminal domain-containing protein [Ramlibacter sp.]